MMVSTLRYPQAREMQGAIIRGPRSLSLTLLLHGPILVSVPHSLRTIWHTLRTSKPASTSAASSRARPSRSSTSSGTARPPSSCSTSAPTASPARNCSSATTKPNLEIVQTERTWSFDADGDLFRLVAEAYRIHLAHLFDPVLAVHTSLIEPLPHQITGVYGEMLPRQPLRFLLADDPGAGKTIMAGLLIKELMVRGDVQRCLICVPGNLADQWQDELWFKFQTALRDPDPRDATRPPSAAMPSWKRTGSSSAWTRSPATRT